MITENVWSSSKAGLQTKIHQKLVVLVCVFMGDGRSDKIIASFGYDHHSSFRYSFHTYLVNHQM